MKTERRISELRALLTRALESKDHELVKQYCYGLMFIQNDRIKELEKEVALKTLIARYKKAA